MLNSLELFSGAGGLAKGIEVAGATHSAFVEWNSNACKTLRYNYNPEIVHETDVRHFDFNRFSGIDLIAGGPPCQPFSMVVRRKVLMTNETCFRMPFLPYGNLHQKHLFLKT